MKNLKKKIITHAPARSILVDFRRFSDFSAHVLHCVFIFEDRKILNTAIWSLDIVLYDRMIKKEKQYLTVKL